jgi:hypothetical protein
VLDVLGHQRGLAGSFSDRSTDLSLKPFAFSLVCKFDNGGKMTQNDCLTSLSLVISGMVEQIIIRRITANGF